MVARNLVIDSNLFTDSSIGLFSQEDVNVLVRNNKMRGVLRQQSAIAIHGSENTTIQANRLEALGGTWGYGIVLSQSRNALVTDNSLDKGAGIGIRMLSLFNNALTGNRISGFGVGVQLEDCVGVQVLDNEVKQNTLGVRLIGSSDTELTGNQIDDNCGVGGLVLLSNATGNFIAQNQLTGNRPWDAEDQSIGSGTAGTGNVWTDNEINLCSPPGLCNP